MSYHYDIVLIEDFDVDRDDNLIVTAVIQNMGKCTVPQSLYDAPEFAPCLCKTTIYPESLPDNLEFKGKTKSQLEEYVNRYQLLVNAEWQPVINDWSDYDDDNYYPSGSRIYF